MPTARDPFAVLGVTPGADCEAIKRAFRTLALRHHPDRSDAPDADARFRELVEAYERLVPARPSRGPRPDSSAILAFYAWLAGRQAQPPPDEEPEPPPADPGERGARLAAVVGLAYALALLALVLAR